MYSVTVFSKNKGAGCDIDNYDTSEDAVRQRVLCDRSKNIWFYKVAGISVNFSVNEAFLNYHSQWNN